MKTPHRTTRLQRLVASACAAVLMSQSIALPAVAQNNLPALGDTASDDFNLGTERKLGDQIMRNIRRDPSYLDDPILLEYLQSLWQPLLVASRQQGHIDGDADQRFAWEIFLVRDRSVNAFALPGGYVGVHLGLMGITQTRDELASVLAHELTHVTQRHIARGFANSQRQSLVSVAALILGVLAASRSGSGDAANAIITSGQASAVQGMLNFSRDMEREADRVGFSVLSGAGFAPDGMAAMFEKLERSSRLNDSGGFPYLRTHPLNAARIGEARSRLGPGTPARASESAGHLEHTLAQARARVLMDPRIDALRRWQALDNDAASASATDRLLAAYGNALASTLLREWSRADAALARVQSLVQADPKATRALALMKTESLLARGDAAGAALALKPYANDGSRPALIFSAQVALADKADPKTQAANGTDLRRSTETLQTWVSLKPQDALAWSLLAQLWGRQAQRLRALRAEAESRLALGDLDGAADRLRAGQRLARAGTANDFIEASVIDARLRDVETQRKQLAAETR